MPGKVSRRLWTTSPLQIFGAAADNEVLLAEDAGDQSAIGQFTAADNDIHAFGNEIDHPILEIDVQFDLWKNFDEGRQDRHEEMMPDNMRHADA